MVTLHWVIHVAFFIAFQYGFWSIPKVLLRESVLLAYDHNTWSSGMRVLWTLICVLLIGGIYGWLCSWLAGSVTNLLFSLVCLDI